MTEKSPDKRAELPRTADGKLRAYTSVGGYPMLYLDRQDSVLCPACANETESDLDNGMSLEQFRPVRAGVNWEGAKYCDECSAAIEAAYGDDDDEGQEEAR